jgi:hypothetical protein
MQQITIRGIDPEIEREIRRSAKERRKSINQIVKEIIQKEFKRPEPAAASLKQLSGGWNRTEAAEFQAAIKSFEQIDEEMWK